MVKYTNHYRLVALTLARRLRVKTLHHKSPSFIQTIFVASATYCTMWQHLTKQNILKNQPSANTNLNPTAKGSLLKIGKRWEILPCSGHVVSGHMTAFKPLNSSPPEKDTQKSKSLWCPSKEVMLAA